MDVEFSLEFYEFAKRVDIIAVFLVVIVFVSSELGKDFIMLISFAHSQIKKYKARRKPPEENMD